MTFDPNKPVQTRDGRKVRIICTDKRGLYPIVALISDGYGESCSTHSGGGKFSINREGDDPHDLINVPECKTLWANVYNSGLQLTHKSRKAAVKVRGSGALGLASLTIEDGKIIAFENHPLDGGDDE